MAAQVAHTTSESIARFAKVRALQRIPGRSPFSSHKSIYRSVRYRLPNTFVASEAGRDPLADASVASEAGPLPPSECFGGSVKGSGPACRAMDGSHHRLIQATRAMNVPGSP